jgi:hypothetical protein
VESWVVADLRLILETLHANTALLEFTIPRSTPSGSAADVHVAYRIRSEKTIQFFFLNFFTYIIACSFETENPRGAAEGRWGVGRRNKEVEKWGSQVKEGAWE